MYSNLRNKKDYCIIQKIYTKKGEFKAIDFITNLESNSVTYDSLIDVYENVKDWGKAIRDGVYVIVNIESVKLYANCIELVTDTEYEVLKIVEI